MGTYSYVQSCDLKIINEMGLSKYIVMVNKGEIRKGVVNRQVVSFIVKEEFQGKTAGELEALVEKGTSIVTNYWEEMNGWKIIGYWYDEFVMLLEDVAAFVEGEIRLESENGEDFAIIEFGNGEVNVSLGTVRWEEVEIGGLVRNEIPQDDFVKRAKVLNNV